MFNSDRTDIQILSTETKHFESIFSLFFKAVKGKEHDFTSGSISRAVIMLSIPMILEMLMESVFALVDIIFVSKVSVNAVATVGLTESVLTLVYAVAIGLSMGATAIVARRTGEKDREGAQKAAVQVIFLGIFIASIISLIGIFFPKEILYFMGGEPDLIEEGFGYTKVLLGGNMTVMLLFLINAVFRGAGNASIAMWTLILSNGLNIILDPIFIFGFGPVPAFGVEGAAIATTTGRGIAVLAQLYILFRGSSYIKILAKDIRLHVDVMINLVKISLGGIFQFFIGTSSWVFLILMMATFGSEVLAGYTIAIRVMMFTLMPAWGMSNAAATLVGQNLGAEKPDRAEKSVWKTGKYCAYFMGLVSLIYILGASTILRWFSDVPEVVEAGALCLQIIAAGYIAYAYGMVVIQAFNGSGDTKTPTWINFICFWLIQLPVAYFTAIHSELGPQGIYWSITGAEILIAIIGIWWFRKGKWKSVQV